MQKSKEATCLLLASAIIVRGVVAAGLAGVVVDLEHLNLRRGLGVDVGVEDENLNPLARRGPAKHLGGSVRCRILLLAFDPLDGAASAWRRLLLAGTSSRKLDAGGHPLGACARERLAPEHPAANPTPEATHLALARVNGLRAEDEAPAQGHNQCCMICRAYLSICRLKGCDEKSLVHVTKFPVSA